eukprot:6464028-Amphidinium_carterae.1
MSASHMKDVHISARKALGKGASLRRSSPLEVMAWWTGRRSAELNTICIWQRRFIMFRFPHSGPLA